MKNLPLPGLDREHSSSYSSLFLSPFGKVSMILLLLSVLGIASFAQNKKITGKVLADDGNPLSGVTVTVKGGSAGTATANDGSFSISATAKATLVFSAIGYSTQEFAIGDRTS